MFVEYLKGPGGSAALTVDGNRRSGSHFSSAPIDGSRIGPDDGGADAVSLVWDDHGLVNGLTFPTSFRIAGLTPISSRNGRRAAVAPARCLARTNSRPTATAAS